MDPPFIAWYTPPPLTPELQALKEAAEALMHARGVWDIDSYGWLSMKTARQLSVVCEASAHGAGLVSRGITDN